MKCSIALALDKRNRTGEGPEKLAGKIEGPALGPCVRFERNQLRHAFAQPFRQVIQMPAHRERWPAIELLLPDIAVAEIRLTPELAVESIYLLADEIADIAKIRPT